MIVFDEKFRWKVRIISVFPSTYIYKICIIICIFLEMFCQCFVLEKI